MTSVYTSIRSFTYALAVIRFDTLLNYADDMEQLISSSATKHLEYLEEQAKKIDNEDILDQYWDYNHDRIVELRDDYPSVLRYSVLVACYSNMEKTLSSIYEQLKDPLKHNLPLKSMKNKNLKGSTSEKIVQLINEVIDLSNILDSAQWVKLKIYIKLRNKIVHENGKLYVPNDNELINIIESMELIKLDQYREIVFESGFVQCVIKESRAIIRDIFLVVQEYLKDRKR